MAKNEISDYDETDANNTDVSGVPLAGSVTTINQLDGIVRAVMGALKRWFKTSLFRLRDSTDQTKLLAFDLSGLTTATTRTLTISDASGTVITTTDAASQAALEGEGAVGYVRPSHVKYSPGVAKCWVHCGIAGNIYASYGVSSVTDNAAGDLTINQSVTMGANNGPIIAMPYNTTGFAVMTVNSYTDTSFRFYVWNSVFVKADAAEYFAVRYGDLP